LLEESVQQLFVAMTCMLGGAWVHVTLGTRRKKKFLCLHITILAINGLTLPSSFQVELKMPSRITGMQQLDGKIFATSTELKQQ
jgi:hypothetical protein